MQRLSQSGALKRLHSQWFPSSGAECSSGAVFTSLSLPELFAVVIIVPLACLLGGVMLGGELLCGFVSRGRRPNCRAGGTSSRNSWFGAVAGKLKWAQLGRTRWSTQKTGVDVKDRRQ